jgi:hypothetical protein
MPSIRLAKSIQTILRKNSDEVVAGVEEWRSGGVEEWWSGGAAERRGVGWGKRGRREREREREKEKKRTKAALLCK